jgi:type VI secretion system protein ImpA
MQTLETGVRYALAKLLAPVSTNDPSGLSLRYDPVYDRIRESRREDDATLPQGVWKTEQKQADWMSVETLCLEVLETRSKDLQVAAWLLEAALHLHGFSGLADGFGLILALCESYWDDVHPRIVDGDVEFRNAPLIWINNKLPVELKLCPLTAPSSNDVAVFAWTDWEIACQVENSLSKAAMRGEQRRWQSLAAFQQSVALTPTSHFRALLVDIERTIFRCEELELLLDEKLQKDSPSLVAVRSAAEPIERLLSSILQERDGKDLSGDSLDPMPDREETIDGPDLPRLPSRIQTRAEAYALLAEAADFLERAEPHSPTPYLIRRAVHWGSLSFAKLLQELVRNQAELSEVYRLLDLKASPGTKD